MKNKFFILNAGGVDDPVPTPGSPESGIPVVDGLDSTWNSVLQYIPEDKRAEVIPHIKDVDARTKSYEPWNNIVGSGLDPSYVEQAINITEAIKSNPQFVYEQLAEHLGITPKEAKKVLEDEEGGTGESTDFDISKHPQFQQVQQQLNTLAQIELAKREEAEQAQLEAEAEAEIDSQLKSLKQKHGDFPEKEILMRMHYLEVDAEGAYQDYVNSIGGRQTKPAPYIISGGGQIPKPAVDPKKLNGKDTRSLVTQILEHSNIERKS